MFHYIFPMAFVSAPIFAEQFYFTLQCFEIAFAMVLTVVSVYSVGQWIYEGGSRLWLVPGLLAMVWCFGTYQAFLPFYIAIVLISFLLWYQNEQGKCAKNDEGSRGIAGLSLPFQIGIRQALVFFAGFIAYLLTGRLLREAISYESAYVSSMFKWGQVGLRTGLGYIWQDIRDIYFANWDTFYSPLFLPLLCICMAMLLYRGYQHYKNGGSAYWVYFISCGLLAVSPLFLTIIGGYPQMLRGQFVYPLLFAFCLGYITTLGKKLFARICCIISVFTAVGLGNTTTQLFHTAVLSYEQEKAYSGLIYDRISQVAADAGLYTPRVVFVGTRGIALPGDSLRGDVIGKSFFEWDQGDYAGSTRRIMGFWIHMGYYIAPPTLEDAELARKEAEGMPCWPATDSVRVNGDLIIVKLSE